MSIIDKNFSFANRTVLIALVALAGFAGSNAKAQVAPQLLPYSVKVIAGGGTTATYSVGQTCPVSGNTATDKYGDGCLATEVQLNGARYVIADASGNVFLSDFTNKLVRRVDAITGVITTVAGGATASPAKNATCGTYTSTDALGDGCLGTAVALSKPAGLAFDASGDLYFADPGNYNLRMIAATGGLVPATGGVITLVDGDQGGQNTSTYGYEANPATCTPSSTATCIVAATQGAVRGPYGIAADSSGNLYFPDYYFDALLAINPTSTLQTITGVAIPPGTVGKIAGALNGGVTFCTNGTTTSSGCSYGTFATSGSPAANASTLDDPWAVAVASSGKIYLSNEYNDEVALISPAGIMTNFAGIQGTLGKSPAVTNAIRATAGSFAIGASLGLAVDSIGNVYVPDLTNGLVWRVDAANNSMYAVAGGASTVCSTSIVPSVTVDSLGDGCPGTSAKFGASGTYGSTSTAAGVYGVAVDGYADLFVADPPDNLPSSAGGLIREVASGTQFGPVNASQPTQYVDIHFAAGDGPATTGAYALATIGASNFSLGTAATCTLNSDSTKDCVLAVKATPTVLGPFSGTLNVTSALGAQGSFPLSGDFVASPVTRTVLIAAQAASCTNTTAYNTITPVILTATIATSGANPPGGTVTFYANGTQIVSSANPVNVNNNAASLTYTFSTPNTYAITAVYSGDSYYKTSTGTDSITSSTQSLVGSAITNQQSTVTAGQTAFYSFTLQQNVYAGTISFACSGLPANSVCSFYPSTMTASGCQMANTIAMSILTQNPSNPITTASLGGSGRGWWLMLGILPGLGLALLIGLRRRKASLRYGQIWMALALLLASVGIVSCNGSIAAVTATPAGTYTVTVNITGTGGPTSSFTVPLTVH